MKSNKPLFCLTLLFSLLSIQSGNVYAQTDLGNACWLASDNSEPGEEPGLVNLGVQQTSGGHLILNGLIVPVAGDEQDSPELLSGNGEVIGDQVVIGLSLSANNSEEIGTIQLYLRINLNDLSGTYEGIGSFYDRADQVIVSDTGSGTLTWTDCPS